MIKIQYDLNGQEDPKEDLEDKIDAHMASHGMNRCGDGGVSEIYRELEYEASNEVEETYMSDYMKQSHLSFETGEVLIFNIEPWDED